MTINAAFNGSVPKEIVFIPKGETLISASYQGKPKQVKASGTKELAALLNSQLQESIYAASQGISSKPFVDFNHENGRASAHPVAFGWDEELGVMLELEWTPAGQSAVEGKEFSYFSPRFAWDDKTKQIMGLQQPGAVGGLVNTPAFQNIPAIAASLTESTTMDISKLLELLKTYGIELSPESDMEAVCSALEPKLKSMACAATELPTVQASLATATEELATLKKEKADAAIAAAHSFVDETIKAGRVTKDARDHWIKLAVADLAGTKAIVASFNAAPAKETAPSQITLTASHVSNNPQRKAELAKLIQNENDAIKRAAYYSEWNSL